MVRNGASIAVGESDDGEMEAPLDEEGELGSWWTPKRDVPQPCHRRGRGHGGVDGCQEAAEDLTRKQYSIRKGLYSRNSSELQLSSV